MMLCPRCTAHHRAGQDHELVTQLGNTKEEWDEALAKLEKLETLTDTGRNPWLKGCTCELCGVYTTRPYGYAPGLHGTVSK